MNKLHIIKNLSLYFLSLLILSGCASPVEHLSVVENYSNRGDCRGAESYARQNISGGKFYLVLGGIYAECAKDKSRAVETWKMCAIGGHAGCKEMLIRVGEKVPKPKAPNVVYIPPPAIQPQPQVIIQQVPSQPAVNLNACIQDGGPIYCPRR